MEVNAIWKSKVVSNYSLKCRDCGQYIFKEKENLKDGVYVDDSFYSDAVCSDCLENYDYCEECEEYSFTKDFYDPTFSEDIHACLELLKKKHEEMKANPEFVGLLQDWTHNYEGKEN